VAHPRALPARPTYLETTVLEGTKPKVHTLSKQ
jgi:hypothetical protein